MAQRTVVELVDDFDGSEAAETVTFGLDGQIFEMDLSEANAAELRESLEPWITAARRVGGRRNNRNGRMTAVATEVDTTAVRAWAASNGFTVSPRGRISKDVLEAFRAAGN